MENIIGVNEVRMNLSSLLKEIARKKETIIITSKSKPKAVLMDYEEYKDVMRAKEKQDRLILKTAVDRARKRAKAAGLTDDDVKNEIRTLRNG